MVIEIGVICAKVYLEELNRRRIALKDETDFGLLLSGNIELVLPLGYTKEGKYNCLVYDEKEVRIKKEGIRSVFLYDLDGPLEDFLKSKGIQVDYIKNILLKAK